ncbi:hypothetical protein GCM10007989_08480 [Devosia pacifica]|uniref:Cell division protein FtsL n=1 Tax=Devosia pacifica TaxID=1335967 RepID=A0A918RYR6_9HYPH|nr:hypothetical protein [Devosia pacifica]GHA15895.1 hypothetical protein GCM10007989_08480 [Devosia pacifica]
MIKTLNAVLLVVCGLAFTGVYALKFAIQHEATQISRLESHISDQEAELSMLKADWAVLTQPGHIEPVVIRHQETLQLAEVEPEQFGRFTDLPMRPAKPDAHAMDALFQALEVGVDPIGALLEEID